MADAAKSRIAGVSFMMYDILWNMSVGKKTKIVTFKILNFRQLSLFSNYIMCDIY